MEVTNSITPLVYSFLRAKLIKFVADPGMIKLTIICFIASAVIEKFSESLYFLLNWIFSSFFGTLLTTSLVFSRYGLGGTINMTIKRFKSPYSGVILPLTHPQPPTTTTKNYFLGKFTALVFASVVTVWTGARLVIF